MKKESQLQQNPSIREEDSDTTLSLTESDAEPVLR